MSLLDFMATAMRRSPASPPGSLLERHLCFCTRTKSIGIDHGPAVWIMYSRKPHAGVTDWWPATEREVRRSLGWSEERFLQTLVQHIKAHHYLVGEADCLSCRILNECERRLNLPISRHPFEETAEGLLRREGLLKSINTAGDPAVATEILKRRYGLSDAIVSGRTNDAAGEIRRLLRPILMGFTRHPKFLYFEVDNEPWGARHQTHGISCWLHYTVIHTHFAPKGTPTTLCVFTSQPPDGKGDSCHILATQNQRVIDYLRSHAKKRTAV
jgi:hypothetical protein